MKKLLSLVGTLLLVAFNFVQVKGTTVNSASIKSVPLSNASTASLENCGISGL